MPPKFKRGSGEDRERVSRSIKLLQCGDCFMARETTKSIYATASFVCAIFQVQLLGLYSSDEEEEEM